MKRKSYGFLNGIIAAVSYGTNPLFVLPLYKAGIGVNSALFYRYATAALLYFLWLKFIRKISLRISKKEAFFMFIMAIFFSISSLTLYDSFHYIDSGIACTILFIYPILVALMSSIFFKEKLTKTVILAILMTFVGIFFLYGGKQGEALNIKGVTLVITSAISYALYIVGVKNIKEIKHMKPNKLSFYVMLFGLSVYIFNLKGCTELQPVTELPLLGCILCIAIFPTIISLETITISIKLVGPTITSILGALEPLTAIFFGMLVFGETLSLLNVIGVILILLGVSFIILRKMLK